MREIVHAGGLAWVATTFPSPVFVVVVCCLHTVLKEKRHPEQQLAGRDEKVVQDIEDAANKIGYVMAHRQFNSREYWVPQNRPRVYGICLHVAKSGKSWSDAQRWVNKSLQDVPSPPVRLFFR